MRFTAASLSLALAASTANAFSGGAGGCAPGQAAVAGLHVSVPNPVTGSLESAGISVTFDGAAPSAGLLSSSGSDVEVASDDGFRGVLIMSVDPAVGITPVDGVQPAGACAAVGATGVTHFDPSVKESVEAVVDCQAPEGSTVNIGVTVVVSNNANDGSEFYYSEYAVACGEGEEEEETGAPVTGTVSPSGTENPSEEETGTQTPSEEETGTQTPSEEESATADPSAEGTGTADPSAEGTGTDSPSIETTGTEMPMDGNMTDPEGDIFTEAPELNATMTPTMMDGNETDDMLIDEDDEPTLPALPTLSPGIAAANSPSGAVPNNAMLSLGASTAIAGVLAAAAMFA